jgi:S1-C subfamily serine protease
MESSHREDGMIRRALASLLLVGSLALGAAPATKGRPWLGVTVQTVGPDLQAVLGAEPGVAVVGMEPGGPAAKAGLRCLDLVTGINDRPVAEPRDLVETVVQAGPGGAVTLALVRDGKPMTLQLVVASRAGDPERPAKPSEMLAQAPVTALCDLRRPYGFVAAVPAPGQGSWRGLVVRSVTPDSPAVAAGLERGMVIGAVGRVATDTQEGFEQEVARWSGQPLILQVAAVPGGSVRVVVVRTGAPAAADPAYAGSASWPSTGSGRHLPGGAGGARVRPAP